MEPTDLVVLSFPIVVGVAAWLIGKPRVRDLRLKTGDTSWITALLAGTTETSSEGAHTRRAKKATI